MTPTCNKAALCFAVITRYLGQLKADQRGNVAIMAGLLMVPLIGSIAVAVEVSNWYMTKRAMQNAADAAAVAAATNASSNYNIEAKAVASQFGYVDGANNVTVTASNAATCPTLPSGLAAPCYSVTITNIVPLYLSQVVGFTGSGILNSSKIQSLSSTAIAANGTQYKPICLLALSQSGTALRTDGAPNSNFTGCTVMSDSGSTCNGSNLNASYGLAHNTNSGCGNTQVSNVPVVADPYKYMASNIPTNACGSGASSYPQEPKKGSLPSSNQLSGTKNWGDNTVQMCGDVQLTGNVVVNTTDNTTGAVLVIENGQLDLNGYTLSTSNGSALTIVFSGTSGNYTHAPTDNSSGQGGVLNIQAPDSTSALFPGMAIYQDPSLSQGVDITYKGNNPDWQISGGVYLSKAAVQISGDVSKATNGADCFVMVANTILINGTSNIYQQTPDGSGCKSAGLIQATGTISGRGQLVN